MEQELAFAPATELRQLINARQVSSVELTELFYRRIEALNPRLNAYLTLCPEPALAAARAADAATDRGEPPGPLHGIPLSVKDLEMTKDLRTTLGSNLFRDRAPELDSVVVERVRAAGAIILGKTNTPEFGLSGTTENRLGDACRTPGTLRALPAVPVAARRRPWLPASAPWRRAATGAVQSGFRPASAASLASNPPRAGYPATAAMATRRPTISPSPARCPAP